MATKLEMVLEAIDRASGPIDGVVDQIDRMERAGGRASGRMDKAMRAIGTAAKAAAIGGIAALTGAIVSAGNEAIKFEDIWSDANKTLGFSETEMPGFQDAVNELSRQIPIARSEIVGMTGDAGRLGIKGKEALVDFVELAATAASAFEVDPSQMAKIFGNLRETLKYDTEQLEAWADKVNWLGNNTAASEAAIADYASAVQGIALEAGLAEDATLALGAAMIASGRAPEVATTGLRAFLRTLQKGEGGLTGTQTGYARLLGIDMDEIQQQMLIDAEGAIRSVSEAISNLDPARRGEAVSALFGEEAGRALGPLLTNAQLLEEALGRIEEFGGGRATGALREEFAGAADDVRDNWKKLQNSLSANMEQSGTPFLDPINNALKEMIDLSRQVYEAGGLVPLIDDLTDGALIAAAQGFGEAFQTVRSALEGLDLASRLAPLQDLISGNLATVGDILSDIGSAASAAFGDGSGAREALGWIAGLTLDGIAGMLSTYAQAQARVLAVLKDLSAWFASSVGTIDWSALVPSGGIDTDVIDSLGRSLTAFVDIVGSLAEIAGKSLLEYFSGYFEGLIPYLEPMGNKLSGISDALGDALSNMADAWTAIADALGLMSGSDMSGLRDFGAVMGTVAGVVGNLALGTLLTLAKWIETMAGAISKLASGDFAGAVDEFTDFFGWLADFVLPDVDIAGYFSELFSFSWDDVLPDWSWSAIIGPAPDWSGYLPDWMTGAETPAPIDAPDIKGTNALKNALSGGAPDIASPKVGMPDMASVDAAQATVDALSADAATAEAAVAALGPQAQAIVSEVQNAMSAVEAAASLNLFGKGASMMDTLAAGMRSRAQAAVQEMQNLAQQLRDHLPSSPAKVGPLSDIHRLKFGETIAASIRPDPVVRAMRGLTAAARAEMALGPAGLDGAIRGVPAIPAGARDIRLPPVPRGLPDEEREADMVRRMAASRESAAPSAPAAQQPMGSGRAIDASMHIGTVNYGSDADKEDFEAKLSRHRRAIKEMMDEEQRRRDRTRF